MITNPTPGDLVDRLAVVRLKVRQAKQLNEPCAHFLQEQDEILLALSGMGPLPSSLALDLAQLHERLWRVTDEQKEWVRQEDAEVPPCARDPRQILADLWNLNMERYRLKHQIDQQMGRYVGREKLG